MPELSVIAPVYRAADCLDELHRRLVLALEPAVASFEVILIDDASPDSSWDVICELARRDSRVRGVRFSRNFGQHYAISAGLDLCDGDWVVVMDCDLQDAPEDIPALLEKAREGYDIVVARRAFRNDPFLKRLTSRLFYRVFRYLTGMPYDGRVGNFRVVSRKVVGALKQFRERLRFFGGLCVLVGFREGHVDVVHGPRYAGETSYSYRKLFSLATDVILAYSDKPLRLAIRTGFLLTGAAILAAGYFFWRAVTRQIPVSGWASLIVSLYFLTGVVLFMLGILGVYLGRVFDEVKGRPLYVITASTGDVASLSAGTPRASLRDA